MQQPAIQAALNNLVEVIRTALTAEFLEYFRGEAAPVGGRAAAKGKAKAKGRAVKAAAGGRRTADGVEQLGKLIVGHLKKNPDARVDHIAQALGDYSSRDLALPIKKLLAEKSISKKGNRRATVYRAR